jgi:hypothetical protein
MNKLIVCSTFSLLFAGTQLMGISLKRTLKAVSEHELSVEISISKGNLNDYAVLNERIPQGAELKYAKSDGGSFEIKDNSLKYLWPKLPKQENLTISYIVNTTNLKEGIYSINGKFTVMDNGKIKVFEIETSGFVVNEQAKVHPEEPTENVIQQTRVLETEPVSETAPTAAASVSTAVSTAASTPSATPAAAASVTPAASTASVAYGLQLLSTKEKLAPDYFNKKYNVSEKVKMYTSDGLNKYVMGEFKTREQAQHIQETLIHNGCKDAFLVAYSNNQRISLEEAKRLSPGN